MKSRIFFPLFIALVFLFAAGCGSSPEAVPEEDAPEQAPAEEAAVEEPTEAPTATTPPAASNLIIFASDRGEGGDYNIFSVDPQSGAVEQLTEGIGGALYATWSPDRQKIAFSSLESGSWRIYMMDADGSNIEMVTDFSSAVSDWFPSGDRLIFNSDSRAEAADVPDLYAMNLDGSDLVEIIDRDETLDFDGHVSPDGSRIVFTSNRVNMVTMEIFVADIDGSNLIQLTDDVSGSLSPDWAPDGERILFRSFLYGSSDLFVINADGSGLVQLTDLAASEFEGDWSPDGEQIVFISNQGPGMVLTVMDADGSNMVPLIEDWGILISPDW